MDVCVATKAAPSASRKIHAIVQDSIPNAKLFTLPSADIPQIQQAVVTPEVGLELNVHYSKIPVHRPAPGEVTVKIAWTGVCRSDLSFSKGPLPGFAKQNHIAGHEGIGFVIASYEASLLGKVVAARYVADTCHKCWACLRSIPNGCKNQKNFPKHHDGTFQEYVTAPWTSFMPLDAADLKSGVSLDPALYTAALCSGAAALKALRESNVRENDVVLIFGVAGGIGHLASMMARKIFGALVIGVDRAEKVETLAGSTALELFDTFVAAPESADDHATFAAKIGKACIDLRGGCLEPKQPDAIIMAASSEEPYHWANLVRDGGVVACLSVLSSTAMLSVRIAELVERQICIKGVMMGGRDESYEVMQYIRDQRIKPIITKVALRDLPGAIAGMTRDAFVGKLVVAMDSPAQPR